MWYLGGAVHMVGRRTRDRKVACSTPGRGDIKLTRSTQPSIPPGQVNRVPACMAGVRQGAFTCVGQQVTLCDPIWQLMSPTSGFSPGRVISAFMKRRGEKRTNWEGRGGERRREWESHTFKFCQLESSVYSMTVTKFSRFDLYFRFPVIINNYHRASQICNKGIVQEIFRYSHFTIQISKWQLG